jgi:prenyltransferase beta subunit
MEDFIADDSATTGMSSVARASRPCLASQGTGETPVLRGSITRRNLIRRTAAATAGLALAGPLSRLSRADDDLLPKHVLPSTQVTIKKALDYLAKSQSENGNWGGSADGTTYPCVMASLAAMAFLAHGDTPSRGPYADNIRRAELFILSNARQSGIITSASEEQGRSMYGHGFSMLFLASVYGMETDIRVRDQMKTVIKNAIQLTSKGQSAEGGWTYIPGAGDEGSVTVTQMQGLRAASNAGFTVPKTTTDGAVKYLEKCKTPEGGIVYSLSSRFGPQLAISAAAVATLYSDGKYESPLASQCLAYVWKEFQPHMDTFEKGTGHEFYTNLYASQAFYQAGDKYWDAYYPKTREQLRQMQEPDGSFAGDSVGPVYGAAVAAIILQLPYKFLPIYQR